MMLNAHQKRGMIMKNIPELIVMLTHNDKTVNNAKEVFEAAKDANAKYWGFKEVGIPISEMKELVSEMKKAGKFTFLEVVAYTQEDCVKGAAIAVACGFDALMGTLYFDIVKEITDAAEMEYYPFVGKIEGRPSVLKGTIEGIIEEGNDLAKNKGVAGIDLLGYRFEGDAIKLNEEFVKAIDVPVCLAGSVNTYERLDEVKATEAWAFTIGGAFFENKFKGGSFKDQIDDVVSYISR